VDYNVLLDQYAEGRDGRGSFVRSLRLPFVPFPGLRITWDVEEGGADDGEHTNAIESIWWDVRESCFLCYLTPDKDRKDSWQQIRDYYEGKGWTLEE